MHRAEPSTTSARLYAGTWLALLLITVLMLVIDNVPLPRTVFLLALMSAMLVKATLIGANFMHLKFERRALVAMVVVGLFVNGAILFVLMAPDALRIGALRP
jgi:caa(3)-type oxidase subunit IV